MREALDSNIHLLVTGGPGQGKSTMSLRLAADIAAQWVKMDDHDAPLAEPVVPLRLTARTLAAQLHLPSSQALAKAVHAEYGALLRTAVASELLRDLPGRHSSDVKRDIGHLLPEARHQRQQGVNGRFVRADEHTAPAQIAKLAHGRLGFLSQPDESLAVVLEDAPGVRERPALRRPVEQLLTEVSLQAANRLTHGGLGAMDTDGGARKAPLLGDRQKHSKG
jgi:hypothetical protein